MKLTDLTAISPVDGRYRNKTGELSVYFSEFALIRDRVMVEVEYFIALCEIPLPELKKIKKTTFPHLRKLYQNFSEIDAQQIKDIEKITNHDVKSVEYFLKQKMKEAGLSDFAEFVHFGLTSQDINNTALPFSLKKAVQEIYLPTLLSVIKKLSELSEQWKNISMLARTHGQPASPTKAGKEIRVFTERLNNQLILLKSVPFSAKFGGATGNLNAHYVAYPDIDWIKFCDDFVNRKLGLFRLRTTTQIEHYDNLAALFDAMKRINTILIDLCRDFWTYISMDYFTQKIKKNEVGSSAMPHKVNPIDFENAEGNLGYANAIFEFLSSKLPVSRLQRDLTDSTVTRNTGVPLAHTMIAFKSLLSGLEKIVIHPEAMKKDLENNWSVISEAIQTVLRRESFPEPYEALKKLTRKNAVINKKAMHDFIDRLPVSAKLKQELKKITPENYTGK